MNDFPTGIAEPLPRVVQPVQNYEQRIRVFKFQNETITVNPDVQIYPSGFDQSETIITRSSTNQNLLFASANSTQFPSGCSTNVNLSEGIYVSLDGGQTWTGREYMQSGRVLSRAALHQQFTVHIPSTEERRGLHGSGLVIPWNSDNDNGVAVASGIYIYKLKSGDFVATKKLVIIK